MSLEAEPIAVTLRVASELERLGIEYLVRRSSCCLAADAWREFRAAYSQMDSLAP